MVIDHTRLGRNNFIHTWLIKQDPSPDYTAFDHIPLAEVDGAREVVFVPLTETIFVHHNDPEEIRKNLKALDYSETASFLDKRPRNPNTRKCNFGEILASEYLRQFERYKIPVYRLRYNPNPESPMKGDDVLAFKFAKPDGTGREVLVAEAKVRSRFATKAVVEAYDQLESGHRPRPKSILFVVTILRKEDRDDEANQVLTFLNKFAPNQPTRRNLLFLVTGNKPRDPFRCIQEQEKVIENLMVANVYIAGLGDFVNALFEYEVEIDEINGA